MSDSITTVRRGERGVTLLEALVAMMVLGVVLTGLIPSLLSYTDINTRNEMRTQAVQAAQVVLEGLRRQPPSAMPGPNTTATHEAMQIGSRTFDLTVHYCANTTYCNDSSRHILVEVSFDAQLVYTAETIFTELR